MPVFINSFAVIVPGPFYKMFDCLVPEAKLVAYATRPERLIDTLAHCSRVHVLIQS
jgi:hypothetical protein